VPLHDRAPSPAETPHFRRQFLDALTRRLEATVAETLGPDRAARATLHLVDSHRPGQAIARHADARGADLIAIGTRGETSLRDLLLGGTTERVLRDCVGHDRAIAILAVKPRAFASPIET
jgi:nucleotide-binding universal stress UspA family protein